MNVSLIYTAAGSSRRFGSNKLLYAFDGKPLYLYLLDRLTAVCARHPEWELILVTRYPEIYDRHRAAAGRFRTVYSAESHKGMSYTIRAGLEAAREALACAFFVADQPFFTEQSAEAFLTAMEQQRAPLGCVRAGGRYGNPGWFSSDYFRELMELEGDQGGRRILERHQEDVVYFPVSGEWELWDLDTAADACVSGPDAVSSARPENKKRYNNK